MIEHVTFHCIPCDGEDVDVTVYWHHDIQYEKYDCGEVGFTERREEFSVSYVRLDGSDEIYDFDDTRGCAPWEEAFDEAYINGCIQP